MARTADFDLAAALRSPSFTPGARDLTALVELVLAGDDRAPAAIAQLAGAREALVAKLDDEDDGRRARGVTALGVIARRGDRPAGELVIQRIGDRSPRVRRAAILALGKLADIGTGALLARWDEADVTPDERRALAEALGKLGGDAALAKLRALDPAADAELARRRDRAVLVAERDAARGDDSSVRDDVDARGATIVLRCKSGFAPLLAAESSGKAIADDAVTLELAGPWRELWRSRLWMTAGIRIARTGNEPDAIARAIVGAAPLLVAWTRGPVRWRLDVGAGKQRATIWKVAKLVRDAAPMLINDPTSTTWDIAIEADHLELRPRRVVDPRFAYRVADVPAASHPTVAAALAFVAGARPGDRVWDPFCGSGLELIERAKLGPVATLAGTDLADAALAAARANLDSAHVTAQLERGDSRAARGDGDIDLAISNPPLGSRVQVDAPALLADALPVIARRLAPKGRLVWIVPAHAQRRLAAIATRLGLRTERELPVDLGQGRSMLVHLSRP
ncbi:MAG TPA: methyltransferase [Kofleriaceae bacterium]|jgi:predicted RNA methylase|nr:methyltransferase [Kofleriaceae bacterium]